jgi:hypothetical protein
MTDAITHLASPDLGGEVPGMKSITLALFIIMLAYVFVIGGLSWAQDNDNLSSTMAADKNAAQSIAARTRTEISRLGVHNIDTDRALRMQSEGDRALRNNEPVRAAEYYGRAEEAAHVLDRESTTARDARDSTDRAISRAQRGGENVAQAESYKVRGDQALESGNYHTAEVYYAEARADLSTMNR